jgi:hypothetical protein
LIVGNDDGSAMMALIPGGQVFWWKRITRRIEEARARGEKNGFLPHGTSSAVVFGEQDGFLALWRHLAFRKVDKKVL